MVADRRTLTIFRVAFGVALLADLARRWPYAELLFSDAGVLPVALLDSAPQIRPQLSLLMALRSPLSVQLAFAAVALLYLAYLAGFQMRVTQPLVAMAVISLNTRNLFFENGGTVVLCLLATITVLLPLGAPGKRKAPAHPDAEAAAIPGEAQPERTPFAPLALLAVWLQTIVIYGLNAIHKLRHGWLTGDAVHYVLWQDRVATDWTVWLRAREPWWYSPLASYLVVGAEAAIAILLAAGLRYPRLRTIAVAIGMTLHVFIAIHLQLWPFSLAMIALLALAIPGRSERAKDASADTNANNGKTPLNTTKPQQIWRNFTHAALSSWRARLREALAALWLLAMLARLLVDDPWLGRFNLTPPQPLLTATTALRLKQSWAMYAEVPRHDATVSVQGCDAAHLSARSEATANYLIGLATPRGAPYLSGLLQRCPGAKLWLTRSASPPVGQRHRGPPQKTLLAGTP